MKYIHQHPVYGKVIDQESRCDHWNSKKDIVSIKFYCCQDYYPCADCHSEESNHAIQVWPKAEFDQKAILCGACGKESSIAMYLNSPLQCSFCKSDFNPRCQLHWDFYFER